MVAAPDRTGESVTPERWIRVILSAGYFLVLALLAWPAVLGLWVGSEYVGQPEERRYFSSLSLLAVAAAGLSLTLLHDRIRKLTGPLLYLVAVVLLMEFCGALTIFHLTGESHLPRQQNAFSFHPSLVGMPTPGYRAVSETGVSIEHNSYGFRGIEPGVKRPGVTRVVTIGGSSTYGVLVSNHETWAHKLGELLGDSYEVLNLGVPGHSSAEHVIYTALSLSELEPDYVLYYMGWNDLRNSHLSGLKSDYSDFHLPDQYSNLRVERRHKATSTLIYVLKWVLVRLDQLEPPKDHYSARRGTISDDADDRLLRIYERNLSILTAAARVVGAEPLFVPQVLNDSYRNEEPEWWVPFIPVNAVVAVNERMSEVMRTVAERHGVRVARRPGSHEWVPDDFIDLGHFTPKGNAVMATLLHDEIRQWTLPQVPHAAGR